VRNTKTTINTITILLMGCAIIKKIPETLRKDSVNKKRNRGNAV
jgi:hypothetical protein